MINSLRIRLLLFFIALAVGPLIIVSTIVSLRSSASLEQQSQALQREVVENIANEIRNFVEGQERELVSLSRVYGIETLTIEQQRTVLGNLLIHQQNFHELALLNAEGQEEIRLSRSGVVLDNNLESRAENEEFLLPATSGDTYYGPVRFDETLREPLITISLPFVDLRSGELVFVLVADLRFKTVWDLLTDIEIPLGSDAYVLNPEGRVVAHRNPTIVLSSTTLDLPATSGRAEGLSGTEVVFASNKLQFGNQVLLVVAEQPVSNAFELNNTNTRIAIVSTTIALVFAIVLAVLATRSIVSPIDTLVSSVRAISGGNLSQRVQVSDPTEIGQLAVAFNQMAQDLEEYRNHLQGLVAERTAKLTQANEQLEQEISERMQAEEALRDSNRQLAEALTELKRTQQQIIQQERLAAVGQLAAGVAHDFNNILTSILGFAELIQMSLDTPQPIRQDIARIINSTERAAHLVRQILDFSRKSIIQPRQLNLTSFVIETTNFLKRTLPENIRISLEIERGECLIMADPTQLQQMLTNLAINARDVMPEGGDLKIQLSHIGLRADEPLPCDCPQMSPGEWAVLLVADTGTGISAEVLPHIFEPFFTTKTVGEGPGLGLAQVYGIVNQHKGCIEVTSLVGQGTTFTIYLPALIVNEEPLPTAPPAEIRFGSGETILLVEDEPAVLEVSKGRLEALNYHVLTATNGKDALTLYAKHKNKIALVLSDMIMPVMDGAALFKALQAQNPDIRLVIMTGYSMSEEGQPSSLQGVKGWLSKPMSFNQLSQVISEVLLKIDEKY